MMIDYILSLREASIHNYTVVMYVYVFLTLRSDRSAEKIYHPPTRFDWPSCIGFFLPSLSCDFMLRGAFSITAKYIQHKGIIQYSHLQLHSSASGSVSTVIIISNP